MLAAAPARPLAEVVLYAEFDLTAGSTLRASYPAPFAQYSPEFFADVMLPEGVHNREEDFTVFFLNRQNAHQPADDAADDPLQSFMYCLSVVRTTHDAAARRGAKVTAVALCSTHKSCFALRDVLNLAVLKIVGASGEDGGVNVLKELYSVVNAVDISGVRGLTGMERRLMKRTISSTGRAAANQEDAETLEKALFFRTQAVWDDYPVPLQFKICSTDDQHDDGTLTQLLQTFGDQTMVLFNAVLTGQRVIMLGYNRPAGEVYTDAWLAQVLDGVAAGYDEEWVRCMFEEYTRKNVVDIALGEANYLSPDALAKRSAINNKRITKWARTDSYKRFMDSPHRLHFHSPAFDISYPPVSCVCLLSLQGDMVVLDDTLVEKIYSDFATLLNTEFELQEFLSFLPVLRGGLQTIAQGIFHPSISVKYNTVVLLKRLEQFPSTASSMRRLNAFLLMSYQRIHDIVKPDTRN
ncbi:unnamed protein product [Phytophthora lilii]|uniref:Unnamed protein product n=1 Tax=Phytophthora lilii TaxID=2077276 RepID=A0A9W6WTJ8_9STRA|nr:unnamed protein product [Phytophthora lilii]